MAGDEVSLMKKGLRRATAYCRGTRRQYDSDEVSLMKKGLRRARSLLPTRFRHLCDEVSLMKKGLRLSVRR